MINTLLTGRRVTAPDRVGEVTPELFFALSTLRHNQTLESPAIASFDDSGLEDDTRWQSFRAQVVIKADIEGGYLDQKRSLCQGLCAEICQVEGPYWRYFDIPGHSCKSDHGCIYSLYFASTNIKG